MSDSRPVRVAVVGAAGRMGTAACAALEEADGLDLVARVDVGDDLAAITAAEADVVVDLTHPDAVMDTVAWCVQHRVGVVAGTSGFTDERVAHVEQWLTGTDVGVLIVPNFSVGAVLMMLLAEQAAPYFESVEVVELHHPDKRDAPSGTALRTAQRVAAARAAAGRGPGPDATVSDPEGTRGGRVDGVPVHALRLRGLVAHQEVLLGGTGETLTIRHDSLDRSSFMPGLVAAARWLPDHPGMTVGLEHVLGLGGQRR